LAPDRLAVFFRADFAFFLAPPFFAPFFAEDFFAAPFFAPFFAVFFAAMLVSWECEQVLTLRETLYDGAQDTMPQGARNRDFSNSPYGEGGFSLGNRFAATARRRAGAPSGHRRER
jgi:hypothetical protein